MKAIQYSQTGNSSVLNLVSVTKPVPKPGEILINVKYAALNHLDLHFRRGLPGLPSRLPHIPGSDASGIACNSGSKIKEGDRVMVNPGVPCGNCLVCNEGNESLCHRYQLMGREFDGSYSEYVLMPEKNVHLLPSHIDLDNSAAFSLVYLTAWSMLKKARIQPGHSILIMGAGSGVSMAAIQISKHFGLDVITTAGSDEKCTEAKKTLGADHVINYKKNDIHSEIKKLTHKKGVDCVIDHVGGSQWESILKSTRNGGRIISCGATDGFDPKEDLRHIFFRQLQVIGSTMGTFKEYEEIKSLYFSGHVSPLVDSQYDLESAAKAQDKLEERKAFGKIILNVS